MVLAKMSSCGQDSKSCFSSDQESLLIFITFPFYRSCQLIKLNISLSFHCLWSYCSVQGRHQSINQDFEWTFQIYLTRDLQSVYGYHTVHNYVLITQAKEEFSWVLIVLHLLNFLYRNNGSVASVFVAKLVVFEIHMVNGLVLLNTLILEMQLV